MRTMGNFTSKDRDIQTRTYTLLQQHVKVSDERHVDMKEKFEANDRRFEKNEESISDFNRILNDHDKRIAITATKVGMAGAVIGGFIAIIF